MVHRWVVTAAGFDPKWAAAARRKEHSRRRAKRCWERVHQSNQIQSAGTQTGRERLPRAATSSLTLSTFSWKSLAERCGGALGGKLSPAGPRDRLERNPSASVGSRLANRCRRAGSARPRLVGAPLWKGSKSRTSGGSQIRPYLPGIPLRLWHRSRKAGVRGWRDQAFFMRV
jgi:hypothetical protein